MRELTEAVYTKRKKVCGVGVNDYNGRVVLTEQVDGKTKRLWTCPMYETWTGILKRCYNNQDKAVTYRGVKVSDDWLYFSKFREWMNKQDYEDKFIDKDILSFGKDYKMYSEDTCAFVSRNLNNFFVQRGNDRGKHPLGVSYHKKSGNYLAACSARSVRLRLGYHKTPSEAHKAWQKAKLNYGRELQELEENPRVQESLKVILDKLEEDYNNGVETKGLV